MPTGGRGWEADHDPCGNSLRLLPSGPDRVGEALRPQPTSRSALLTAPRPGAASATSALGRPARTPRAGRTAAGTPRCQGSRHCRRPPVQNVFAGSRLDRAGHRAATMPLTGWSAALASAADPHRRRSGAASQPDQQGAETPASACAGEADPVPLLGAAAEAALADRLGLPRRVRHRRRGTRRLCPRSRRPEDDPAATLDRPRRRRRCISSDLRPLAALLPRDDGGAPGARSRGLAPLARPRTATVRRLRRMPNRARPDAGHEPRCVNPATAPPPASRAPTPPSSCWCTDRRPRAARPAARAIRRTPRHALRPGRLPRARARAPEEAVAREVFEEAGVRVAPTSRYHSSQPWPFPASLMLGYHGRGDRHRARPRSSRDRRGALAHARATAPAGRAWLRASGPDRHRPPAGRGLARRGLTADLNGLSPSGHASSCPPSRRGRGI